MQNKTLEEIRQAIGKLREQKGKEKETLKLINEALSFGHDFVANLFLEEALTHQHLFMNDSTNKEALADMEKAILKAKFYIDKYKLTNLNPELFRFLGKVEDLKRNYKKAISYYKKSDKTLQVDGNISYSMIMSGKHKKGYKLAKDTYGKFISDPEGLKLKKNDSQTWTIWLSGLVIRTINALFDRKVSFNTKETNTWIRLVEKELNSKVAGFSYRKQEFEELKNRLKLN